MSATEDKGLSPEMVQHVAEVIVKTLRTVGAGPPEGCAVLALAYAVWVESEPEATPAMLVSMLATSAHTSRESFRILRTMRGHREELLNAAAGAMQ